MEMRILTILSLYISAGFDVQFGNRSTRTHIITAIRTKSNTTIDLYNDILALCFISRGIVQSMFQFQLFSFHLDSDIIWCVTCDVMWYGNTVG